MKIQLIYLNAEPDDDNPVNYRVGFKVSVPGSPSFNRNAVVPYTAVSSDAVDTALEQLKVEIAEEIERLHKSRAVVGRFLEMEELQPILRQQQKIQEEEYRLKNAEPVSE